MPGHAPSMSPDDLSPRALGRTSQSAGTRPRLHTELLLLSVSYVAYAMGRVLFSIDAAAADARGRAVIDVEDTFGISGLEPAVNQWTSGHYSVAVLASYGYATLHYLVTPAVLIWLYRKRPSATYRSARNGLLYATAFGLVCYALLPTTPPRLLAHSGFVDVLAQTSSAGWWSNAASAPAGLGG